MIDKNDPRLTAYLFQELSDEEMRIVEDALAASPELRSELRALQNTSDLLTSEFRASESLGIGAERLSKIESMLGESTASGAQMVGAEETPEADELTLSKSVVPPANRAQAWWILAVAAAVIILSIPLVADLRQMVVMESAKHQADHNAERADEREDAAASPESSGSVSAFEGEWEDGESKPEQLADLKSNFETSSDEQMGRGTGYGSRNRNSTASEGGIPALEPPSADGPGAERSRGGRSRDALQIGGAPGAAEMAPNRPVPSELGDTARAVDSVEIAENPRRRAEDRNMSFGGGGRGQASGGLGGGLGGAGFGGGGGAGGQSGNPPESAEMLKDALRRGETSPAVQGQAFRMELNQQGALPPAGREQGIASVSQTRTEDRPAAKAGLNVNDGRGRLNRRAMDPQDNSVANSAAGGGEEKASLQTSVVPRVSGAEPANDSEDRVAGKPESGEDDAASSEDVDEMKSSIDEEGPQERLGLLKASKIVETVEKMKSETRSRIIETDKGPKEVKFDVEVPVTEQVELNLLVLDEQPATKLLESVWLDLSTAQQREFQLPKLSELKSLRASQSLSVGDQFGLLIDREIEAEGKRRKLTDEELRRSREKIWSSLIEKVKKRSDEVRSKQTWKRVRATPNSSRLLVGDKDELPLNGMQVNVHVEGFRARVVIDCLYYNDRARQLEGNFKIRLPDDASLYYFAFGQSRYQYQPHLKPTPKDIAENEFGAVERLVSFSPAEIRRVREGNWDSVKESRMVTKEKAAFAYTQTVRRRIDPALVEWTGGGIFNARVFPLMPNKMHRIVLGYDVDLRQDGDDWVFDLDLPEEKGVCQVNLHLADQQGTICRTVPVIDPVESNFMPLSGDEQRQLDRLESQLNQAVARFGKNHDEVEKISRQLGELRNRFDQRTDGDRTWRSFTVTNPDTDSIQLRMEAPPTTLLRSVQNDERQFFALRTKLDIPEVANTEQSQRAVFLLDTSLSSQPDKFNVWLKLLEATLANNEDTIKEFAVQFFSVDQHFWRTEFAENNEKNRASLMADCSELALEGATDLYGAFQRLRLSPWVTAKQPPVVFLLSDGNSNWGESNPQVLAKLVASTQLGSIYAFQTGLTGTAIGSLRSLTNGTGGAVFSVANEQEIEAASMAFRSRPWCVNSVSVENGADILTAGRLEWVYPSQLVTIVGRVQDPAGELGVIRMELSQGEDRQTVVIRPDSILKTELADRIFGHVSVEQLEELGEPVVDVAAAYARHFRITGKTCSLLMLESEEEYRRFNIAPQDDQLVVQTRNVESVIAKVLNDAAEALSSPTEQLKSWIYRLEKMEGLEFRMPTGLKMLLDEVQMEAVSGVLNTNYRESQLSNRDYLEQLASGNVSYRNVDREARRRLAMSTDDAVKALSSLVEVNQGDLVLARDVAFSAMEWKHPAPAYHMLRRVAEARPFEPSIYPALGRCLAELGEFGAAMVFYEVALETQFTNAPASFRKIVAVDYSQLLRKIDNSQLSDSLQKYARLRLESLAKKYSLGPADIVVTMMWNTDQTDVDLHIIEPSGEECFYRNQKTRSGGEMTEDVTTGYGPEMYVLPSAPQGRFKVLANYFAANNNRGQQRGKVYIHLIRDFGRSTQTTESKTVVIENIGEKNKVYEFEVDLAKEK